MTLQVNDELINELTTFFMERRLYDPLFSAYDSASDLNVTGDGTIYTVIFDTEIVDRNANYNNATGIFTAPVSGYYLLLSQVQVQQAGAAHTQGYMTVVTSNRSYFRAIANPYGAGYTGSNYYGFQASVIADMDATDTAYIQVVVSGGAKTVDVFGGTQTMFQGYLLI